MESRAYGSCILTRVELLLKLVDSFLGWPEVVRVPDKKSPTIKQILRVVFSRNGIPKKPCYPTMHQNLAMKILVYSWKNRL